MLPVLQTVVSTLLANNLGTVAQAVLNKGLDKVEEKLGVKLEPAMSEQQLQTLRLKAQEHEQFLISESNQNTASARTMNSRLQESANASWLSKNTAYVMDFFILASTVAISSVAFFIDVPDQNKELVYMALGSLLTMTTTVVNFHRGSSSGSAKKSETLDQLNLNRR